MTHPLRVAENCTTHPLHKAQNLMTHPLSAPAHPPPPPILFDQSLIWGQFNETFTSVIYKCSHCFRVSKQIATLENYTCKNFVQLDPAGYRFQKVAISMTGFTGFVWTEDLVVGRRILQCKRFGRWTDRELGRVKTKFQGRG